jgi:hypothetical protein
MPDPSRSLAEGDEPSRDDHRLSATMQRLALRRAPIIAHEFPGDVAAAPFLAAPGNNSAPPIVSRAPGELPIVLAARLAHGCQPLVGSPAAFTTLLSE